MLNSSQAAALGDAIAASLRRNDTSSAFQLLAPILQQRIPFAMLDRVARRFGAVAFATMDPYLEQVARSQTIGSWAILGTALAQHLDNDLEGALARERALTMLGDVWYAADTLGERVAGPALVKHFDSTLQYMNGWRADENRWVRRSIGVGVHVWTKRLRGAETAKAKRLLDFLEPLFPEREVDAIKGIGWGLKTLGRYYPDLMRKWLVNQRTQPHRALMLRKATTYLGR